MKCFINEPSLHTKPRYPRLQLQTFGLIHLPWLQPLLHIAKIYDHENIRFSGKPF